MALQYEVTAVPEGLETFYKPVDGKFVLDVEGAVPQTQFAQVQTRVQELDSKVAEFRTNNISLKQQLEAAGKQTVDVEALLEPRIAEMKQNYTSQIESLNTTKTQLEQHLERVLLSDGVKDAAIKYGVLETALPDVISRARETFTIKDGVAVSKTKAVDKEGKPLTIQNWIVGLTETAGHLFAPSRGTGAQRPVSGVSQKPTMSAIDKIASGLSQKR
jgi:outer membrane murein-binding lipoprotein Lpp